MDIVKLIIDDVEVEAKSGETILEAARNAKIYIPSLCSHPNLPPSVGMKSNKAIFIGERLFLTSAPDKEFEGCQLCLVKVENKGIVQSCTTQVTEGMAVHTDTDECRELRQRNLAKILARHPHACLTCPQREGCSLTSCSSNVPEKERCCIKFNNCELRKVAEYIGIPDYTPRYTFQNLPIITNEPLFIRDYNLCIGCLRCVKACREIGGAKVLDFIFDDGEVRIGTIAPSLKESGCKFCGACVEVCPTGTLRDKVDKAKEKRLRRLNISPPFLPPDKWLAFTAQNVALVSEIEGVYQLADEQKNVIYIKGTANLRQELEEQLEINDEARYFLYEEEPMYTRRESELLQQFLQQHAQLPRQNLGLEDLF